MAATIAGLGLGRVYDVVPIAASQGISMQNCNAIDFVCTESGGATTFTLTVATTFAGTYRAYNFFTPNFTPFTVYWTRTSDTAGTVAWVRNTQTAASTVVSAATSDTLVIPLYATQLPDGYKYVKLTATGGTGLVTAVLHDLSVARTPANMTVPGA